MKSAENQDYVSEQDDEWCKRRRMAMKLFLSSPMLAMQEYPDLVAELRIFFMQSSNPHFNQETGKAANKRDDLFEQWETAKRWAAASQYSADLDQKVES